MNIQNLYFFESIYTLSLNHTSRWQQNLSNLTPYLLTLHRWPLNAEIIKLKSLLPLNNEMGREKNLYSLLIYLRGGILFEQKRWASKFTYNMSLIPNITLKSKTWDTSPGLILHINFKIVFPQYPLKYLAHKCSIEKKSGVTSEKIAFLRATHSYHLLLLSFGWDQGKVNAWS